MKSKYTMDIFDLEAEREGAAIKQFRKIGSRRVVSRSQAKRGVLRGRDGAKSRLGLVCVTR